MDDYRKINVPELPERLLLDLRTECNLRCPMCLLHGDIDDGDVQKKEAAIGKMEIEEATKILDEIMHAKPLIQPSMWGEPLLAKNLKEHIQAMKSRDIAVCFNTNGLTLKPPLAEFFVENNLDSIFFSLDSIKPETLKLVRGIDKLEKIEKNVLMMLDVRKEMGGTLPRVGVSFTIQDENKHEVEDFIDKWIKIVDVVRVGSVYEDGMLKGIEKPKERAPCAALYHTLPIHYNGDASICCFDSFGSETVGNVFTDGGVKAVWNGEKMNEIRHYHETGQFDKVPFCKNCNAWAGYLYEEEVVDRVGVKVLERRSFQFSYYNRVDKLSSWTENISRGHEKPKI